jgi:hypothetical protein
MRYVFKLWILSVILLACSRVNYLSAPPEVVRSATTVTKTDFDKFINVVGPRVRDESQSPGRFIINTFIDYYLRGWLDPKTDIKVHQLFVEILYYGEWRYYDSADLRGGERAKFVLIDRAVGQCQRGQCGLWERMGIELSHEFLLSGKDDVEVRFNARRGGSIVIKLSRSYITGYLEAVNTATPVKATP